MDPVYRIYYGRYPDQLTKEIPNKLITQVNGLQFRIEPGKPAEPKVDELSFTLRNLDHNGNELFDDAWFEDESLSQANGAVAPLQLFFRVEMPDYGSKGFTGVVSKKSYGKWRDTVSVTIKDPRQLLSKSDVYMLKPFTFDQSYLSFKTGSDDTGYSYIKQMYDLEGADLTDESMDFIMIETKKFDSWAEIYIDHPYAEHRNYNQIIQNNQPTFPIAGAPPFEIAISNSDSERITFIKIGDNAILTRIKEYLKAYKYTDGPSPKYKIELRSTIYHANNGNYNGSDNRVILERGRYFEDDRGTDLQSGKNYSITIYDYNLGFDDDILSDQRSSYEDDADPTFLNGYEIRLTGNPPTRYDVNESFISYFNVLTETTDIFESEFYSRYYNSSSTDIFDLSRAPQNYRYSFVSDLMIYGWLDKSPSEILVNLATQFNCYLYYNEQGKIVFHDRLYHQQYMPNQLPPDAFEVQLSHIQPVGPYEDSYGFDSYKVEYSDRLPINNVESDASRTRYVGKDGVRNKASLRSSSLEIENYRTDDLGVPVHNDPVPQKILRYSPDDPNFGGVPGLVDSLTDFIPPPEMQAQNFAKSWSYPVSLWKIQWDIPKYPQAGIGKYFWVDWGTEKKVYFIRDITHDPDQLLHKMEVQEIGVYTP